MSIIAPYAEIRRLLAEAAAPLVHPTKRYDNPDPDRSPPRVPPARRDMAHPFGHVVYFSDGAVGGLFDGKYLIAQGDNHEDSARQLAHKIGKSKVDLDIKVVKVDAEIFYARCLK